MSSFGLVLAPGDEAGYRTNSRAEITLTPGGALRVSTATYGSATTITPGTAFTAGSAIGYVLTTAGTVTLTLPNGSTVALPLPVSGGFQVLPFSATNVALSNGAVGSFFNLS